MQNIKHQKTFLIAVSLIFLLLVSVLVGGKYLYNKLETIQHNKYTLIASNIKNRTSTLISDKHSSTTAITIALSTHKDIINFFKSNSDASHISELTSISKIFADSTDYKNLWVQLIDLNGKIVYRSWDATQSDNLVTIRPDVKLVLETKKTLRAISVGKYAISFKSLVPIFEKDKFLGIVEIVTHFNSISKNLQKDSIESVFIADSKFKKQISRPFSKTFVDDFYIANLEVKPEILNLIKKHKINNLIHIENYKIIDNFIVTTIPIIDVKKQIIGYGLLFQDLATIDNNDISTVKYLIEGFVVLLTLLVISILFMAKTYKQQEEIEESLESHKVYEALLEQDVAKKTKELQELNENLEQKIIVELEKNRKQDILLQQQSRLAALGEMIGNIAHQWRQPLSAISSLASGLKVQSQFATVTDKDIEEISDAIVYKVNFLSQTIDDFRNFFKKDKTKERFKVSSVIKSTYDIIKATYDQNFIETEFILDDSLEIDGFRSELIQVLLNLFNNAKDALISNNIEHKFVQVRVKQFPNSIKISIADNAGGIPEHIMDKIFDPYFTTKHQSQGTGLGLYMSNEIIGGHFDGTLYVHNEAIEFEDKTYFGAVFYIDFPKA